MAYGGDIAADEAWRRLAEDPAAALVDVRTHAEWTWVGVPDLAALGRSVAFVSWQLYPSMAVNPAFVEQLRLAGLHPAQRLLLLCRSGIRSKAAAECATAAGFLDCFNVKDGFEGPHDGTRHRGMLGGWKALGLPWLQG